MVFMNPAEEYLFSCSCVACRFIFFIGIPTSRDSGVLFAVQQVYCGIRYFDYAQYHYATPFDYAQGVQGA